MCEPAPEVDSAVPSETRQSPYVDRRERVPPTRPGCRCGCERLASEDELTIREWALHHGFNVQLVYKIARGERKALRGQSRKIAFALHKLK